MTKQGGITMDAYKKITSNIEKMIKNSRLVSNPSQTMEYYLVDRGLKRVLLMDLTGYQNWTALEEGPIEENFLGTPEFHELLEKANDYKYLEGKGFYLNGYGELGVSRRLELLLLKDSVKSDTLYQFGSFQFEISWRSDFFRFLTTNDSNLIYKSKGASESLYTIKFYGIKKEDLLLTGEAFISNLENLIQSKV